MNNNTTNPFLESVKEALNSEGKFLSQEDQELLLRDSESIESLSDKEKESLDIIMRSLFRNFFNNTKNGNYYCNPSKIKEYYHVNVVELPGGINEGMLYRLFVAYSTFKVKILDWGKLIDDNNLKVLLLDEIVRGVEAELASSFFPTLGPVNLSATMRLIFIKKKLENYAPEITFDDIFEVIIPCKKCKNQIKIPCSQGTGHNHLPEL